MTSEKGLSLLFAKPDDTIGTIHQAIASGERTCLQVTEQCLRRIDAMEPSIRAWVLVDRAGAIEQAQRLDRERAAGGLRGPLHGIPIGIKDIIDVAGFPTAAGSELWRDRIAAADAPAVARLRAAGAVILGKTVTTQFASFDPPITRNPWNLERTPGGSSSGSAAAVAVGMCQAALGSQTGGSITRPASFCGVAGCKPTFGRVPLDGIVPLAPSMDHPGPLARTVRDLAIVLEVIADWPTGSTDPVPRPLSAALDTPMPMPPRLGRLVGFFQEEAASEMREALDRALDGLCRKGATVASVELPGFNGVLALHRTVMTVEAAAWHESRLCEHPEDYLPKIRGLVEEGLRARAVDYVRARRRQIPMRDAVVAAMDGFDALVTPAATGPAPDRSTTGDPVFNSPWSYTGLPTVSFPIALSPEGLPLAIQLIGRPDAEPELFRVAAWWEDVMRKRT
jgi:aspartyl-tRNA(Asn)/glutamyl-tRNA(Gln) amidotransferase subunit A